jgi:hypothetical protein
MIKQKLKDTKGMNSVASVVLLLLETLKHH